MAEQQSRSAHFQGLVYAAVISGVLYAIARVLEVRFSVPYQVLLMLAAAFGYLIFRRYDLAVPWNPGRRGSIGTRLLWSWALFVAGLMFVGYITKYSAYFSRELLLGWIFVTPAMIFVLHLLVRFVLRRWMPHMSTTRSCVLVFANESARLLAENLIKSSTYDIKGYFDDREPERTGGGVEGIPFLGKARKVVDYVKENGIQVVFVVLPSDGVRRAVNVLDELGDTTASMYYVPDFFVFNLMQAQVSEIEGCYELSDAVRSIPTMPMLDPGFPTLVLALHLMANGWRQQPRHKTHTSIEDKVFSGADPSGKSFITRASRA